MTVLIYRNVLNGDMRRFSRISNRILSRNITRGIKINNDPNRKVFFRDVNVHDTIIIFSHGGHEAIYHRFNSLDLTKIQTLINNENLDILIDKKVIAISCGSAKVLGIYAVALGCKVYLGFKGSIHYSIKDQNKEASNHYRKFLKDCYKETFEAEISNAIEFNWSFGKLERAISDKLGENVLRKLDDLKRSRGENYYNKYKFGMSVFAVSKVKSNILLHGDRRQIVG